MEPLLITENPRHRTTLAQLGSATQPPQQTGQSQHQFPLDGRLNIIVGDNGRFERL
jgi:hypothetical protein